MVEPVKAQDFITLFRFEGESGDAWKLGLQTENNAEESRDFETTQTKDGSVKSPGQYEGTHSISSLLTYDDPHIGRIKEAVRADHPKRLEIWQINRAKIDASKPGTVPGDYSKDYVTSYSTDAGAEGNVEVSIETEVDGRIVSGEVTVNDKLKEVLAKMADSTTKIDDTPVDGKKGE